VDRMIKIVSAIGAFTAFAVVAYWTLVFAGLFPVTELVPGYRTWFMSFPLADAWIAVTGVWLAIASVRRTPSAIPAGAMLGSALLFLGLYALAYGANTGLLFILTPDELVEIAIKVYCLGVGAFLVAGSVIGARHLVAEGA
jgi:hypothetical protein